MTREQYEKCKLIISFENRLEDIRKSILNKPTQLSEGYSKIGYMQEEIQQLNKDLIRVLDMHKELAKFKKELL